MAAPLVGILMGSTSDWEVMKQAAKMLEEFGELPLFYVKDYSTDRRIPASAQQLKAVRAQKHEGEPALWNRQTAPVGASLSSM